MPGKFPFPPSKRPPSFFLQLLPLPKHAVYNYFQTETVTEWPLWIDIVWAAGCQTVTPKGTCPGIRTLNTYSVACNHTCCRHATNRPRTNGLRRFYNFYYGAKFNIRSFSEERKVVLFFLLLYISFYISEEPLQQPKDDNSVSKI